MSSVLDETFPIYQPMDATDYFYELLRLNGPEFGLDDVEYDARLIPAYPAAVLTPGRKDKAFHSTNFFLVTMEVHIAVYHAKLTQTRRERTREDLQLCTDIESTVETPQLNVNNRVVTAYISEIVPGMITRPKGEQVIGSRMTISLISRQPMSKGA